jgi:hypothetical protein
VKTKKNVPIYINDVCRDEKGAFILYDYKGEQHTLDDIDLTPVPLGYVNHEDSSVYAMRIPLRHCWKQGLCQGNFHTISNEGCDRHRSVSLPSERIFATINGVYPKFKEASKKVGFKGVLNVAFSREFAISKDNIFYKGRNVGYHLDEDIRFVDRFSYLKPRLKEVI